MSATGPRFWLGIALIAVGTAAIFGLTAVSGTTVLAVGLLAVATLSTGTLLAGTSARTESGQPV